MFRVMYVSVVSSLLVCCTASAQTAVKPRSAVAPKGTVGATTKSAPKDKDTAVPKGGETGGRFALLVGVEQYAHPKLSPLQFSVDDVTSLSDVLKETGYDVTLLTDDTGKKDKLLAPTKVNFDSKFIRLLNQCKSADDKIILAFAGHGLQFEGQKDAFFCPADAKPFATETDSLISISKIYADLDHSFAGVKIVFVDACRNDPDPGRGRGIEADLIPPPKGVATLFSCSNGERAFESDQLKHGVFFHHVLEGLKGKAASPNGDITFYGLTNHVCTAVPTTMTMLFPGKKQQPNFKADIAGTPPVLARVDLVKDSSSTPLTPMPEVAVDATEIYTEDFRNAPNKGLPDGWVNIGKNANSILVRQDAGRPHLRTRVTGYDDWEGDGSAGFPDLATVRLPPVDIRGDFYIELSAINNEVWKSVVEGKRQRSMTVTLIGSDDEKLVWKAAEDETGFVAFLPGSDESKPFTLAGNTPYKYRLERKAGTYRVLNNSKVLLTHAAADQRQFAVIELELSPKMLVGNIKIGPLTTTAPEKPAVDKPIPKKPTGRKLP